MPRLTVDDDEVNDTIAVPGVVVRGHGVASGTAADSPYPHGTIALQMPVFLARGLDLRDCFPGTINVDIAPNTYTLRRPRHTFPDVTWTDRHPPETFSFLRCTLARCDAASDATGSFRGWVYYPHPETKLRHRQPNSVLELLMPHIAGLRYADPVTLTLDPREITIHPSRDERTTQP